MKFGFFIICFFVLFFLCLLFFFLFLSMTYANPYKLIMVFGKKGSGKTTLLTKLALQHLRKGWNVYVTEPVPGCNLFNVDDIGKFTFPPRSVIFIDEVGMIWDNRNFKNFRFDVRDYFKLQRHYRNKVYLFSQTFDVDVKLRNLTDAMYLCTCHMNVISVARKIKRTIVLVNPEGDSESRIADNLEFIHPIWALFGAKSIIFTYIPRWSKYFNSHCIPDLPVISSSPVPSITGGDDHVV